ncbi:MAG: alpha/beta hydrolase [candidate division KSB1 bacterium]|nr:alpha/beta hydrolase [candidate division KSB1 bacterium]
MNLKTTILILLSFVIAVPAADRDDIIKQTVVYKTINGMQLKADVYLTRDKTDEAKPAMAFFHGGGWAYGNPDEFRVACTRYARKGFVCFSFQYRLSITEEGTVPHPDISLIECVKDARSAMRWIRGHADEYHIDPDKIVASGQSAGGQLALATVLFHDINEASDDLAVSPAPNAFVLYSSTVNTLEAWADLLMGDRREQIWSVSPFHNLKSGLPPTIHFHGTADRMVPYWVVTRFRDKSVELGNHYELVTFEGRRHYLGNEDQEVKVYYDEDILRQTDDFFERMGFLEQSGSKIK